MKHSSKRMYGKVASVKEMGIDLHMLKCNEQNRLTAMHVENFSKFLKKVKLYCLCSNVNSANVCSQASLNLL